MRQDRERRRRWEVLEEKGDLELSIREVSCECKVNSNHDRHPSGATRMSHESKMRTEC